LVEGASVEATVVDQVKGKKIRILKYKPRNRYRIRQGHRQNYTRLRIDEIITDNTGSGEES
jgi:large subunit ribosomal protein L21